MGTENDVYAPILIYVLSGERLHKNVTGLACSLWLSESGRVAHGVEMMITYWVLGVVQS